MKHISCRSNCYFRGTQRRFSPKCIENTFQSTQSTFRSLEKHSEQRYKFFICSVILGPLAVFSKLYGQSVLFSRKFQMQFKVLRSQDFFCYSSLHRIFKSEKSFSFLFRQKIANLGSEMRKIKPQKIVFSLDKLGKLYRNGTVLQKFFQPSSNYRKFQPFLVSPHRYFTENSCWVLLLFLRWLVK